MNLEELNLIKTSYDYVVLMNNIARLKDSFSKDLKNLNRNHPHYVGLKIFQIGILLLASAPSVSFLLLLFSALLGIINRKDKLLKDKYNWLLILSSFLMINSTSRLF